MIQEPTSAKVVHPIEGKMIWGVRHKSDGHLAGCVDKDRAVSMAATYVRSTGEHPYELVCWVPTLYPLERAISELELEADEAVTP